MKKIMALLLSVCMILTMFAGCGSGTAEKPKNTDTSASEEKATEEKATEAEAEGKVFGICYMSSDIQFFNDVGDGVRLGIKENDSAIVYDCKQDVATLISQVEDLITKNVDAIILSCIDQEGLHSVIQQAKDAEIPVFVYDKTVSEEDAALVATQIQTDDADMGHTIAEKMAEAVNYEGVIFCIDTPSVSIHSRCEAAMETLSKYEGITVVTGQAESTLVDVSQPVVEDMLTKYGDEVVGWIGFNENQTTGAINAFNSYNMIEDVVVYTVGDASVEKENIEKGWVDLAVDQQAFKMGLKIAELCYDVLDGKTIDSYYPMEYNIVTIDNLEKAVAELDELRGQ